MLLRPKTAARRKARAIRLTRFSAIFAGVLVAGLGNVALAVGANPGDPLFCQPNEGNTFLILNGGVGVFSVDADCFGNNLANNTATTTIPTSQGGTLTFSSNTSSSNYIYTPPTPGFTGTDTFSFHVTTSWNSAGGTGAGSAARPGLPITETVTLNVIPATTTLQVAGATPVPVPAGSVTGCGAQGNPGQGPPAGAIPGCITAAIRGPFGGPPTVAPSHGTLSVSGNTVLYTPAAGYSGPDTFTYEAAGINTDGSEALESGDITVTVTVTNLGVPTLGTTGLLLLTGLLGLFGFLILARRTA